MDEENKNPIEETKEVVENVEVKSEEVKQEVKQEINNTTETVNKGDKKGLAIAALVLGIISLLSGCVWFISIPCAIIAIIFGIIARKSSGKGMAIAGIITGAIGILITIIMGVLIGLAIFASAEDVTSTRNRNYYNRYNNSLYNSIYNSIYDY